MGLSSHQLAREVHTLPCPPACSRPPWTTWTAGLETGGTCVHLRHAGHLSVLGLVWMPLGQWSEVASCWMALWFGPAAQAASDGGVWGLVHHKPGRCLSGVDTGRGVGEPTLAGWHVALLPAAGLHLRLDDNCLALPGVCGEASGLCTHAHGHACPPCLPPALACPGHRHQRQSYGTRPWTRSSLGAPVCGLGLDLCGAAWRRAAGHLSRASLGCQIWRWVALGCFGSCKLNQEPAGECLSGVLQGER